MDIDAQKDDQQAKPSIGLVPRMINLGKRLLFEGKRNARLASLKVGIEKLALIDLSQAYAALGRKAYEGSIQTDTFGEEYQAIAALEKTIAMKRTGVLSEAGATNIQRLKATGMSAKMAAESEGLTFTLRRKFIDLGRHIEIRGTFHELENEQIVLQAVKTRTNELEKEYATVRDQPVVSSLNNAATPPTEIKFSCSSCGQHISVDQEQQGITTACPSCGNMVTVPIVSLAKSMPQNAPLPLEGGGMPSAGNRGGTARVLLYSSVGCGGLLALCSMVFIVAGLFSSNHSTGAPSHTANVQVTPRVEEVLTPGFEKYLNENKQQIFESVHPFGTATSVTLHEITVTAWKRGQDTNRVEDIQTIVFRYTIYWQGPIEKNGFTKINQTYDYESQRTTNPEVLETNGIRNKDIGNAAGNLLGTWLQYQAQKAGAEEATRGYYNNQ